MELTVVLTRQQLIDIGHRAKAVGLLLMHIMQVNRGAWANVRWAIDRWANVRRAIDRWANVRKCALHCTCIYVI